MMTMLTASTYEVDDIQDAVAEIQEQLKLEKNLKKNAVGILACHAEFMASGMVKALCDALPFDVIGGTAICNAAASETDTMMLSLAVLTSDDVEMVASLSAPIENGNLSPIGQGYAGAKEKIGSEPKLALCFLPMMPDQGGEILLNELTKAAKDVPVYGTVACDSPVSMDTSMTLFNGEAFHNRVVLCLLAGNVTPRFVMRSLTDKKIQRQRAIITASEGSLLKEINNMLAIDYIREIGLSAGDGIEGMSTIPFIVDYNDGSPAVARAMYLVTPEGYIVCGASMPVGATIALGSHDLDGVLETAEDVAGEILAMPDVNGVLLFPCISRLAPLGIDMTQEAKQLGGRFQDTPYFLAYSGGEVCPVYGGSGSCINRFHNFTIIACVL